MMLNAIDMTMVDAMPAIVDASISWGITNRRTYSDMKAHLIAEVEKQYPNDTEAFAIAFQDLNAKFTEQTWPAYYSFDTSFTQQEVSVAAPTSITMQEYGTTAAPTSIPAASPTLEPSLGPVAYKPPSALTTVQPVTFDTAHYVPMLNPDQSGASGIVPSQVTGIWDTMPQWLKFGLIGIVAFKLLR